MTRSVKSLNASELVGLLDWELVALWVDCLLVFWGILSEGIREWFCGWVGGTSKFL